MIQRIQTLFLLGIVICMIAALFLPLIQLQVDSEVVNMTAFSISKGNELIKQTFWIAILLVATLIVAVISIFQYKNRLLQIKLGALISFLCAASVALVFFMRGDYPAQLDKGVFAIMLALILNFFANWFIRRDEKLVRDSDRLR